MDKIQILARKYNSETGSTLKMPEMVRNVVKFTVIQNVRYKKVVVKPEVVVYFGLLLVLTL